MPKCAILIWSKIFRRPIFNCANMGRIKYRCGCGEEITYAEGIYCTSCKQAKCGKCVRGELAIRYCNHCLDVLSFDDAETFQGRCKKCFDCPQCHLPLAFAQRKVGEEKVVYLSCTHCYWTSEGLGIDGSSPAALITNVIRLERSPDLHQFFQKRVKAYQTQVASEVHETKMKQNQMRLGRRVSHISARKEEGFGEIAFEGFGGYRQLQEIPKRHVLSSRVHIRCIECNRLCVKCLLDPSGGYDRLEMFHNYFPMINRLQDSPLLRIYNLQSHWIHYQWLVGDQCILDTVIGTDTGIDEEGDEEYSQFSPTHPCKQYEIEVDIHALPIDKDTTITVQCSMHLDGETYTAMLSLSDLFV